MGRAKLPECRFCGRPLGGEPLRIVVSQTDRGHRQEWGSCWRADCLEKFRQATAGVVWFGKNDVLFVEKGRKG